MLSNALLKDRGLQVLDEKLGPVDMERFIVMLSRDANDYTKWHEEHDESVGVREYSKQAMTFAAARKNR
ncbi:MAG: hypothetical protein LBP75_00260 [Planctomycetota bacterium]|jgi:hypothetical protein|nr:hypothetical protein [Planctomycetota bacterium]